MCGALEDVERKHDIGGKSPDGVDPWTCEAPAEVRYENGEAAEDDK